MHLLYDHPLNGLFFVLSLLFVALFLALVLMDTMQYQPELIPGHAPALNQ